MFNKKEDLFKEGVSSLIEENKYFFKSFVDNMKDGVIIYKDNKIIYINKAAVQLGKGEKPEDFLGKSVFSFVHPDSKQLI
jgi:PAS domain-containing protein